MSSKYIGDKKIKGTEDIGDGKVKVMFKDNTEGSMNKNLFDMIVHDDKRKGGTIDRVRLVLATKFLEEMAELGLDYYMVSHIGEGMRTLLHNLREETVGKVFGCSSLDEISITKLLSDYKE